LMRGAPHTRHSEGKKVANKAAGIPLTGEIGEATKALRCSITLVSVARVGCPLLLKTSLPRPAGAAGAPSGRIPVSIAGSHAGRNHGKGSGSRALRGRGQLRTFLHFDEIGPIVPPVTVPTANWLQAHQRQNPPLHKVSRTRSVSFNAPAVFATKCLGQHGRLTSRITTRGQLGLPL
jgi:hypothetical protein